MPVIGLLSGFSPASGAETLAAFRQGLSEAGFTEHQNIGIEYRWAEYRYEKLPAMAADLVRRQVALILTMPTAAALAAKAATTTIPVVFTIAGDPVQLGLVASLARPGGNVTGTTFYVAQLGSRQLEVLHQLVPRATTVGVLVNPNQPAANVEPQVRALELAATALGLQLRGSRSPASSTPAPPSTLSPGNASMPCSLRPMHYSAASCAIYSWRWRHFTVCPPFIFGATTSQAVG